MTVTMPDQLVARRRAVEALRSGVPSWDAVAVLGSGQPAAEDQFTALLERVREPGRHAAQPSGLLLGGGFGAGKSHLLTHLSHLAMASEYVVSTVVISKETPLHDPLKTFRAAIAGALDPLRGHGVLAAGSILRLAAWTSASRRRCCATSGCAAARCLAATRLSMP
jgi:P-loop Domain of unknown function (DUF2791)